MQHAKACREQALLLLTALWCTVAAELGCTADKSSEPVDVVHVLLLDILQVK